MKTTLTIILAVFKVIYQLYNNKNKTVNSDNATIGFTFNILNVSPKKLKKDDIDKNRSKLI